MQFSITVRHYDIAPPNPAHTDNPFDLRTVQQVPHALTSTTLRLPPCMVHPPVAPTFRARSSNTSAPTSI